MRKLPIKHKKRLIFLLLIIYWIALIVATSLPSNALPSFGIWDKFEHFFAYFGLAVLTGAFFKIQSKYVIVAKNFVLFTIIIVSIYGILDEVHQIFIPGRYCEFLDWFADFAGVLFAALFLNFIVKHSNFLESNTSL